MLFFDEPTVTGGRALCDYEVQHHIVFGTNLKMGWAFPSMFEIRAAIREPNEVRRSEKVPNAELHARPVGVDGENPERQWHTVVFVDTFKAKVTTAYNTISYSQKGDKIWP